MRRVFMAALAGAAIAAAAPASAAVVVKGPAATATSCTTFTFSGANEVACAGGYSGNLLQNSPETNATALSALTSLGYTGDGTFLQKLNGLGGATSLTFTQLLTGTTIIGIHYGAAGDSGGEATSFFEFDAGAGTHTIDVTGRTLGGANALGLSNAVLFSTGAVPEPATWAMMLLGFGGMGMALRRSRRRNATLMQVA